MSAARPVVPGFFECIVPDANVKILLSLEAIDRLAAAAMEGFKAVPRRGLEVGGLLLGRVEGDCVVVEDIEAVDSEHQRGPSWLLSEKDKQLLSATIARVNDDANGLRLVGLYRSQTRAGFAPADEDVTLMREYSSGDRPVFLLVKPEAVGRSTALFAAGNGLQAISGIFPFRARLGGSVPPAFTPARGISAPPTPPPPAADTPRIETHQDQLPAGHVPRLSTARVMEGLAQDVDRQPAGWHEPVRRQGLSLLEPVNQHEPTGMFSRILWMVVILLCAGAGGYGLARWWTAQPRRQVAGTQSIALHAIWSGTNLHLQWNRDAPLIRQANRGILWIDDGMHRRHLDLKAEDLTNGSIQYWPSSSDVEFKLEVFTPGGGASESIRALSVPLPPAAAAPAPMPEPAPPATEAPANAAVARPPVREPASRPFVTVGFEPLGGGKQASPPAPLHRVMPTVSADLRGRLKRDLTVDVRVAIDAAGKVKRAELVSRRSDVRREFETLALSASRGWTFTPARNADRRVPGQAVLHYHFGSPPAGSAELQ